MAVDARPETTSGGAIDAVFGNDDLEAQLPLADTIVMSVSDNSANQEAGTSLGTPL